MTIPSTRNKLNPVLTGLVVISILGTLGCNRTVSMNVMGTEVEVPEDSVPADSGTVAKEFSIPLVQIDSERNLDVGAIEEITLFTSSSQTQMLNGLGNGLENITAGSLQKLIVDLHNLSLASTIRNDTLLEMMIDAYDKHMLAAISEGRANRDLVLADYKLQLAQESEKMASKKTSAAGLGAIIASIFIPGAGLLLGGAAGIALAEDTRKQIPEPILPTDEEIIETASIEVGLGTNPHEGMERLMLERGSKLMEADIAASETMLSSYEILLRRAMFDYEDGLRLAETVGQVYQDASSKFERASKTWDENDARYQEIQKKYERTAAVYQRAERALLLSIVVTGAIQMYSHNASMNTQQYRKELETKFGESIGPDMDVDHIIPKSLGGANHPANYQVVRSGLNRAWGNSHLFEKCLLNPVGFASGLTVSRPGLAGSLAGFFSTKS